MIWRLAKSSYWRFNLQRLNLSFRANAAASNSVLDFIHKGAQLVRQIVYTAKAAKSPKTYSQAVKAAGLIFVSSTAPADPATGAIIGTTIQEQTRQCLTNIQAILEAAGSSMEKIVSATVVMADEEEFAGMNEEWLKWFPINPPARQGAKLPARILGLKVSIAAIAEE